MPLFFPFTCKHLIKESAQGILGAIEKHFYHVEECVPVKKNIKNIQNIFHVRLLVKVTNKGSRRRATEWVSTPAKPATQATIRFDTSPEVERCDDLLENGLSGAICRILRER